MSKRRPLKVHTEEPGAVEFEPERSVRHLETPEKDEDVLGVDVNRLAERKDPRETIEREAEDEEADSYIGQTGTRHGDRKAS